jgi:glycosyltransferase involved in cell wall biosynthesis
LGNYFAIVTCRNSENNIRYALSSLKKQTLQAEYVIVINDGSTDRTAEILNDIQKYWNNTLYVINHPDWGYDIKRVVKNWNEAINLTHDKGLQMTAYHMIATDDTTYSEDYSQKVIAHMDSNPNIAIASGNCTKYIPVMPHGAGRFIRNSFFEKTRWHGYYPEQMGYEAAILYEANRCGYFCSVMNEARFDHTRPLGTNHKFYEYGASMRTLGYHPMFALARFLNCFITGKAVGRKGALYMLYYYLKYNPKPEGYDSVYSEEIRRYVSKKQIERLKKVLFKMK